MRNEITEGTNGKAVMEIEEECYFAEIDGEMKLLKIEKEVREHLFLIFYWNSGSIRPYVLFLRL